MLAPLLLGARLAAAPAAGTGLQISASASPAELPHGGATAIGGAVSQAGQPVAGAILELQTDPYPYHGFETVARATSATDGSYLFTPQVPDSDTRVRVLSAAEPGTSSPHLMLLVEPTVALNASSEGPGTTRLSLRLGHSSLDGIASVKASWFVATGGHASFKLAAVTSTRELGSGMTYASATIDPPASHFPYVVCLSPSWRGAMAALPDTATNAARCPARAAGSLAYGAEAHGTPLPPYPSSPAVAAAVGYLHTRAGRTSLAVVNSAGELSGTNLHEHFETASVVKVMMLVAFLQRRAAEHRPLDEADRSLLYPMIHISDNEAASAVFAIVGEPAVARVARESGMRDYAPGVGWWAFTQTSAADQARFFYELPQLIPPQFYAYARGLLAGIEPSQSWGFPPVARPQWQVFFKTGALPSRGLFNEAARLERGNVTFTAAVFTDGDPSMSYGEQTIEGVASALLAHSP
jgi:hypothetical protein